MKAYRMAVDASICFTVLADNRRKATKLAKELVKEINEGLLLHLPSETHILPDDTRVYVNEAPNLAIENEEAQKP